MGQKEIIFIVTLGVTLTGFLLCIPFPNLVTALSPFGITISGLFLAYCGGHVGETWVNQKISALPGADKGKLCP